MSVTFEKKIPHKIFTNAPEHVAIIMDGNRRWALKRKLPISIGHLRGAEAIDNIVAACKELGVKVLTLFAFSTENWNRSEGEVNALLNLFYLYLENKKELMIRQGIRFSTIGDLTPFPKKLQDLIDDIRQATSRCEAVELVVALNYGSRHEITRAFKKIIEDIETKKISKQNVTEKLISEYLDTFRWKDPDLLIRTSGEKRLSNFLLWQLSYTEVHVSEVMWPDFSKEHLLNAIKEYQQRQRRFGE